MCDRAESRTVSNSLLGGRCVLQAFFYLNYSLRTASESVWLQQTSLMVLKSSSWRKEDSYIQRGLQRIKELSGWKMCYWIVNVWKMKCLKADASVEVGYRQTDSA